MGTYFYFGNILQNRPGDFSNASHRMADTAILVLLNFMNDGHYIPRTKLVDSNDYVFINIYAQPNYHCLIP